MASISNICRLTFAWFCYVTCFVTMGCLVLFVSSHTAGCGRHSWTFRSGIELQAIANINLIHRLILDALLLVSFFVQHSLMASSWFKFRLDLLPSISRSIYILSTAILLQILMNYWLSIPEITFWQIHTECMSIWWWVFVSVHLILWAIVYGTCLLLDLPELVGLKQAHYACSHLLDPMEYKSPQLRRLYKHVRHQEFAPFCLLLYFRPDMTLDRLLLAIAFTVYMMLGFSPDTKDHAYLNRQHARKWNEHEK